MPEAEVRRAIRGRARTKEGALKHQSRILLPRPVYSAAHSGNASAHTKKDRKAHAIRLQLVYGALREPEERLPLDRHGV